MYDIGFINTNIIDVFLVEKNVKEAEDNLLQSLIKKQNKDLILFPLLLERGYSNVIDELCMHAQHPLYSPGD